MARQRSALIHTHASENPGELSRSGALWLR